MPVFPSGMVDVIFADVAQPDQTRIVALNAHNFLKNGGHFVISIKVRLHAFCSVLCFETQFSDVVKPQVNESKFKMKCRVFICVNICHRQANCIDSTASPEAVFASEVKKMSAENMKPQEQLTLEPYERDHAVVVGVYRSDSVTVNHTPTRALVQTAPGHMVHTQLPFSCTSAQTFALSCT